MIKRFFREKLFNFEVIFFLFIIEETQTFRMLTMLIEYFMFVFMKPGRYVR